MIVACANGLLDVERRELLDHTPEFFNVTSVPFDFDARADQPRTWHWFLNELWENDQESIKALQEFFGYVVSGRLDLHKILLIVGPTRAGKGVGEALIFADGGCAGWQENLIERCCAAARTASTRALWGRASYRAARPLIG